MELNIDSLVWSGGLGTAQGRQRVGGLAVVLLAGLRAGRGEAVLCVGEQPFPSNSGP
jgi:hypothetical protein